MKITIVIAFAFLMLFSASIAGNADAAWHGGWHGGWSVNLGWWGPGWGYGWGYPYYPYYSYPYPYYYQPTVIQQQPAYSSPAPEEQNYWYFCTQPEGYYPYIKRCPSGWLRVVPSNKPSDY
ncbi:MAG: hypothetical protein ACLPN1_09060 [Dissulfurispiraceae bacterium]|jgi:hypothetical protein